VVRILILTQKPLATLLNGYDLRVWHLCRELAKRHELYLLTVNPSSLENSNDGLLGLADVFKKMYDAPSLPTNRPSLKRHFRRNNSNYHSLSYPHHFSMVTKAIADVCEQNSISHMIAFGLFVAEFVRPFSSNKKILFDLIDSEVLRLTREMQLLPLWPLQSLKAHLTRARFAKAEACLPHWFNHVTTINDADSDIVCRLSGISTSISTIPNGVSPDLAETFDANSHVAKRRGVAFWGNLSFKPNSDAVCFFYENVYRSYLAPAGIEWCVVGKNAESWLVEAAKRDRGIRLTGFVDNIYSVLAEYPVMVNPMRIGAGLKNKVLEAFAMGLAVVSTGLGIEALSMAREGIDYMRADEPEKTAFAIKLLIEDECLRLSMIKSARKVVLEHYTWSKVAGDLDALLCSL
jgi:glycosyltransferase involved in cell wall biosynthesis